MLRMGKTPPKADQPDSETTMDNQAISSSSYTAQRPNYAPYQSAEQTPTQHQPQPYRPQSSDAPASGVNASARAVSESDSLAREIKDGNLSGFVGNGTMLTGEATFKMMLRIDGHLSGRVSSDDGTLIVGTNGQVDANIEVAVATIHGTVNGDIIASQRLELGRAAKVNGNIQTPTLVIEQGAVFEGSCRMLQPRSVLDKRDNKSRGKQDALDTSSMTPITETTDGASEIPSATDVAN